MTREEIKERTIFYNLLRHAHSKGALITSSVELPQGESLNEVLKIDQQIGGGELFMQTADNTITNKLK